MIAKGPAGAATVARSTKPGSPGGEVGAGRRAPNFVEGVRGVVGPGQAQTVPREGCSGRGRHGRRRALSGEEGDQRPVGVERVGESVEVVVDVEVVISCRGGFLRVNGEPAIAMLLPYKAGLR